MAKAETEVHRTPHHLSFDITGAPLELALAVVFKTPVFGYRRAAAWSVDMDGKRMVLYWAPPGDGKAEPAVHPLPAPMGLQEVAGFVQSWLDTVDYGPEPDTDGSTERGSRVYCGRWGQIEGHGWQSFVAIEAEWLVYGK